MNGEGESSRIRTIWQGGPLPLLKAEEMSTSNDSSDEDGPKRKKCKKMKREQPNKDITKGGIDGIQEGTLIHIIDLAHFPPYQAYVNSLPQVVAYFTGTWCGPAREMNDLVVQLSEYYITLTFLKIDLPIDNQSELFDLMRGLNIRELPTFLFYHEGKQVFKLVGAFSDELIHLTDCLYMRQTLLTIKRIKKEIRKAKKDGAAELFIKMLEDRLSRAEEAVGEDINIYESLKLLD